LAVVQNIGGGMGRNPFVVFFIINLDGITNKISVGLGQRHEGGMRQGLGRGV
jgi:hypothetical protein